MLRVADLDVSGRFYARIGLALREERHGTGPRHLSADLGGTVLELYPRGTGPASTGLRLGLVVPDQARVVDALALARLGANVVADGERDGVRVVVLRDPDGHTVELAQASPAQL